MLAAVATAALTVALSSPTAHPDTHVRVTVSGLQAHSALVVLHGGVARLGTWFTWVPLHSQGGGRWSATLETPGIYGAYPLLVRADGAVRTTGRILEVVPGDFGAQPGFESPQLVAQWWAWLVPPGARLTGVTTWHTGFYTHRDAALNRLLRVDFSLLGDWQARHLRRGPHRLYLNVVRASPTAPWRLLGIVPSP